MISKSLFYLILSSIYISLFMFFSFNLDFFISFFISFLSIFIPYFIQIYFAQKNELFCDLKIEPINFLISFFLNIFKFPIFLFIVNEQYFYYKYGRIFYKRKITHEDIFHLSLYFILTLFLISFISLIFISKYSIIPCSILFSSLIPLKESFGIKIFFGYKKFAYNLSLYVLLLFSSFILFLISLGFVFVS